MVNISKQELIELTSEYVELPTDETQIEFRQSAGSCELSFYNTIKELPPNRYTEYYCTVTYTDFMGNKRLRIDGYDTNSNKHEWYKIIDI